MWLVDKMLDMVRLSDDDDGQNDEEYGYEEDEEDGGRYGARDRKYAASRGNRLSVRQGGGSARRNGVREICLVRTESFEDSADAARYLLAGMVVILDIKGTGTDQAQRVVDFLCGTVYAINGDVKGISAGIFIAAPASVDLTGEFGDLSTLAGLDSQAVVGNLQRMAAGPAPLRQEGGSAPIPAGMAAGRATAQITPGKPQGRLYRAAV